MLAEARDEAGNQTDCAVDRDEAAQRLTIACDLPGAGKYRVWMYSNSQAFGEFGFLGTLAVNASG